MQPINALMRPEAGSKWRWLFNLVHRAFGLAAWLFALTALFYATQVPLSMLTEQDSSLDDSIRWPRCTTRRTGSTRGRA